MKPSDPEASLRRFQEYGSEADLKEYIRATGKGVDYLEAVADLAMVFGALRHGEQPDYESLDKTALQQRREALAQIVEWMADSPKADLKSAAHRLMGLLACDRFVPRLQQCLLSGAQWERLSAIEALGRFRTQLADEVLKATLNDADDETREAVRRALSQRG